MTYVFNVHHRSVLFGVYMSMVFVSNLPGLIETFDISTSTYNQV